MTDVFPNNLMICLSNFFSSIFPSNGLTKSTITDRHAYCSSVIFTVKSCLISVSCRFLLYAFVNRGTRNIVTSEPIANKPKG